MEANLYSRRRHRIRPVTAVFVVVSGIVLLPDLPSVLIGSALGGFIWSGTHSLKGRDWYRHVMFGVILGFFFLVFLVGMPPFGGGYTRFSGVIFRPTGIQAAYLAALKNVYGLLGAGSVIPVWWAGSLPSHAMRGSWIAFGLACLVFFCLKFTAGFNGNRASISRSMIFFSWVSRSLSMWLFKLFHWSYGRVGERTFTIAAMARKSFTDANLIGAVGCVVGGFAIIFITTGVAFLLYLFFIKRIPYADIHFLFELLVQGFPYWALAGFAVGLLPYFGDRLGQFLFGPPLPMLPANEGEFRIGVDAFGRDFCLTDRNLNYHVEIVAPTGAGKTNLLKHLLIDRISRGHSVVLLDLKAEFDLVRWLMRAAKQAGRQEDVRLVSLTNHELSVPYNPIKSGTAPEIHSQVMNSMRWSDEYYRNVASMTLMTLLQGLCEFRDLTGLRFHLGHIYALLTETSTLRILAARLGELEGRSTKELVALAERLDRPTEREKISGLTANLNILLFSAAGPLLSEAVTGRSFSFNQTLDQPSIACFLINSLKLKESAVVLARLILQDLMRCAGDRYAAIDQSHTKCPMTLIVDEFAAFATPEFIEFMDRARGAGIGIVIAHQSRADLREISPEFQERVEANANTVIVAGKASPDDAEYYASMLGTFTTEKETKQVSNHLLFGDFLTGDRSVRDAEEFIIHPNVLKSLSIGEAFVLSRTIDPRCGLVTIPKANEFECAVSNTDEIIEVLKTNRLSYFNSESEKYLDLSDLKPKERVTVRSSETRLTTTTETWR